MKKIGIMGGTFNPIHNGHLLLAQWALEAEQLDEIWFMPTGISYSKEYFNVLPGEERLRMVELAIEDNSYFSVSDLELRRDGYTYTYETLEALKSYHPDDDFYFIMGADCLYTFENWKKPEYILQNCTLLAAVRGDVVWEDLELKKNDLVERLGGKIKLFPFINYEISSTEIRNRIKTNKEIRYLVPEAVREYITQKGFYHE